MRNHKVITTVVASSFIWYTGIASALSPNVPPDITIQIAGSTIQDNYVQKLLAQICKTDTLDTYRDNDAVGKGTYYRAFFCTFDSSKVTGLKIKDPKVLLLKRNRSGAVTGVYPLLEPDKKINMMGINNVVASGGVTEPQCAETTPGSRSWSCRTDRPGDLFLMTPDMGVSDIDPQIFRGANYNSNIDGITFAEPTSARVAKLLTVKNAGAVVQGIPVTQTLRDALQSAEIEMGKLPPECAGDETERCMPSLSKALVASLFAGRIANWSDIKVEYMPTGSTVPVAVPLTDFSSPPDTKVYLCRRNKGASTQASFNAYFLNNPCSSTGINPAEISNPLTGPLVVTPTQVTAEEDCLADFNDGTNNGTFNPNNAKAWAIGMLTTERNTSLAKAYRFIKIDGSAPTIQEVAAGHYTYFSEATYHWRKVAPKPTGDKLTIIQKIARDASSPSILGSVNATINQPWGQGTFLAVSSQGYPVQHPFDPANPVTPYTHAPIGSVLDNCRFPQVDPGANGMKPTL
jgi:ABC-type phosphate transport system substrate-binding protein